MPVATRGERGSRAGGSRLGQRYARATGKAYRWDRLTAVVERWAPPGGWIVAAMALATLSAAAGVILPMSPAGLLLQSAVGTAGAPLVPAWSGWLTWMLARRRRPSVWRATALATLSATWLLMLALRQPQGGGASGETILGLLDAGFGRGGGLAIVSIAASTATVSLVGLERILGWLAPLAALRLPPSGFHIPLTRHTRLRLRAPAPNEPVILGPPSLPATRPAPTQQHVARTVDRPAASRLSADRTPWKRPDHTILGQANDGGSFSPAELKGRARIIEDTLLSFNIEARVVEVQQGPAITQFGVDPAPGVAVNRIVSRQNDLALRLGAPTLRVLAPVPGRPMVGIEVPNTSVAMVKLGDLISAPGFARAKLPIGIGMDVSGKPVVADLTRMPHLLVAGATGSGKSVCINSLITSLLITRTPDEVQLILIDPKQVELSQYRGLPHLRLPVVTDMEKVVAALRWTVLEMERRYGLFAEVGARNIVAYNDRFPDGRLVYLVVVVDELADMMMTAAEDVERLICRLAQLGRAAGVHLVVATQRPSVDVLTGLIKANLPTRIAFAVSSQIDSRVILDRMGAEKLLGRGDALYQAGDEMNPRRVQGALVSDDEIEAVCGFWRLQGDAQHTAADEAELEKLARQEDPEERLLAQARQILNDHDGEVTPGYLARKLKIGMQKASRIHQSLVADEAAAYALPPHAED
ncbi:MAG TPA: DNA translocase FtsK [Chloroflexota bacterium]|nr:DNA translocase FtsK [Chloroflexota bacterium]